MAKKTQRRAARHERDQLGCSMWGFISMFNFRHGRYIHKLLVDQRHGSKYVNASGNPRNNKLDKPKCSNEASEETMGEEEKNIRIEIIKPSVKKLIEQELFNDREIKKEMDNIEGQVSDSEIEGRRRKKQRKKNRIRGKSCENFGSINVIDNAESDVHRGNQKLGQSMRSLNIDNMIEEFCCELHHVKNKKLKQNHEEYKERLRELVKFLLSQKLLHGNRLREDSEILTSKDLMKVFQILGSDEELFLELLQDPDLLVPRDVQDLQIEKSNASEQSKSPSEKKQQSRFFRRKNRQGTFDHNKCESSDRIIIRKPGSGMGNSCSSSPVINLTRNNAQNERFSSNFFLSEIKKKLKHAIKKDQEGPSRNGFRKSMPTKDHFFIERMARPSMTEKKLPEVHRKHEQMVSNIYIVAKKHLSEMLNNEDLDPNSTQKQVTLGRLLSFPEYLSPIGSPRRRYDQDSSTVHRRSASADLSSSKGNKKEYLEIPSGHAMEHDNLQSRHFNDNPDRFIGSIQPATIELTGESVDKEDGNHTKDNISSDNVEIIQETEINPEEADANSAILFDQENSPMNRSNQIVDQISTVEDHDELREGEILKQASVEESQSPGPSSSVESQSKSNPLAKIDEPNSTALDLQEWSSPVSVLEPLFIEDDISPIRIRSHSGKALKQPLRIQFEENDSTIDNRENRGKPTKDDKDLVFKYVEAIIDAIDSDWEDLYLKSQSSDQLLEPALISNVSFYPTQLCSDHELLFDCINEVLLDFCSYPIWVSFYKTRRIQIFSRVKSIVHEIQESVYGRILPLPLPHSLDRIIKQDMVRAGHWLDIRNDVDCIGIETVELILDELLEEFVFICTDADESLDPIEI